MQRIYRLILGGTLVFASLIPAALARAAESTSPPALREAITTALPALGATPPPPGDGSPAAQATQATPAAQPLVERGRAVSAALERAAEAVRRAR